MLVAFVIHARSTPYSWLDFKVVLARPLPYLLLMISILRLTILSTSYLIPYYLGGVRGFRALQVGDTLIWIAVPQLIICPLAAFMLRRSDPRITASLGLCLIGLACMTVAYSLTPTWGSDQFLPSQLMQAVGQSFALSGIVFFGVLNLKPQDALSFGAMLQIARLFGGEAGTSFITTLSRIREQRASNLIGQHLQIGSQDVQQRLAIYGRVLVRNSHQPQARTGGPRQSGAHDGDHPVDDRLLRRGRGVCGIRTLHAFAGPARTAAHAGVTHTVLFTKETGMRPAPGAASLAILAWLAGCAVGPDYKPPTPPPGAAAPFVSVQSSASTQAAPPNAWWELYDDPVLNGLIARAFTANEDLKTAEANLSAARAILEGTRSNLFYPQTGVELAGVYGRDPTFDEILELTGRKPQTTWLYDSLFDMSYELDLFGHVRRSIEAARR